MRCGLVSGVLDCSGGLADRLAAVRGCMEAVAGAEATGSTLAARLRSPAVGAGGATWGVSFFSAHPLQSPIPFFRVVATW